MITLDAILAQKQAIDAITRAHLAGRLSHGLIFAGPVGVGKGTTARAMANLLLCDKPQRLAPCGACPACIAVEANAHPDYHIITKEHIRLYDKDGKSKGTELSVKVVRVELVEAAGHTSVMGRGKVFVIEQAELMNTEAQNAVLKTLEEPAQGTLIVLLTDQPDSLLETIRSRCQLVRFAPLPADVIDHELAQRGIQPDVAADAAKLAEGSLGMALKWIEDGVVEPAKALMNQLDAIVVGGTTEALPNWFQKQADAYGDKQVHRDALASKSQATSEGLGLYLHLTAGYFHRLLVAGGSDADYQRACSVIELIDQTSADLDANVNVGLLLQRLALKLEGLYRG